MSDLARSSSDRGDVVLRRRLDGALELRVNGVFVMDDRETSSERQLARAALDARAGGHEGVHLTVLVGGLGLGFTLSEVLGDDRVDRVIVAEIEPDLVDWHLQGLIPAPAPSTELLANPRVEVHVADVGEVVGSLPRASLDIILLDVDNGPGYLVYESNAGLYQSQFLATSAAAIRPDGILAIWSAGPSPSLVEVMEQIFDEVEQWPIPVILGTRATTYHLFIGRQTRRRR